jgi:hypothetical protein
MPLSEAGCMTAWPASWASLGWCGSVRLARIVSCIFLLLATAVPCMAQLRPLEPLHWRALEEGAAARAGIGIGVLGGQRASLAGTRGTLLELGNWFLTYRSGRFAFEFAGTAVRHFDDDDVLDPPYGRAAAPDGEARVDAGDVRIATLLRLFGDIDESVVVLRFGTRLPTTSDEPGLDRDRTDFFGTAAARHELASGVRLFGEAGVGIHSTMLDHYPQTDVIVYDAGIEADIGSAGGVRVRVLGHDDLKERVIRGNEDLAEARIGGWLGHGRWVEAQVVRGLAEFSPDWGLLVSGGMALW